VLTGSHSTVDGTLCIIYGEWRDFTGLGSVLKLTSWWPGCWTNH